MQEKILISSNFVAIINGMILLYHCISIIILVFTLLVFSIVLEIQVYLQKYTFIDIENNLLNRYYFHFMLVIWGTIYNVESSDEIYASVEILMISLK